MAERDKITNVVIAGLGGQGVITASDILAEAAFRAGRDVKKSELHGMSQRGGSVTSDVRFGAQVFSPMVPRGEADFLVVLAGDQVEPNRHALRPGGRLIPPEWIDEGAPGQPAQPERRPARRAERVPGPSRAGLAGGDPREPAGEAARDERAGVPGRPGRGEVAAVLTRKTR